MWYRAADAVNRKQMHKFVGRECKQLCSVGEASMSVKRREVAESTSWCCLRLATLTLHWNSVSAQNHSLPESKQPTRTTIEFDSESHSRRWHMRCCTNVVWHSGEVSLAFLACSCCCMHSPSRLDVPRSQMKPFADILQYIATKGPMNKTTHVRSKIH